MGGQEKRKYATRKRCDVQSDQRAYDSIFEVIWTVDEQVSLSNHRS